MSSGLSRAQLQLLQSEYRNMLSCVRCGACLTSCPTYVLTGHESEGPRGRVAMLRGLLEGELAVTDDLLAHEAACLVCDACTAVCPAGVHMEPLQVAFRGALGSDRPTTAERGQQVPRAQKSSVVAADQPAADRWAAQATPIPRSAFWLFKHMGAFRAFAAGIRFYQRSGLQWLARHTGALRLLGLSEAEALLPPAAGRFLKPEGQRSGNGDAVALFAGCIMSTTLADLDHATVRVLERAGCEVTVTAGQACCGALNAHGGDLAGAQELARRNISAFQREGHAPIIVNSAGCGAMLKEYAHLLPGDHDAQAFSKRVVDLTEFLATRQLPMNCPQGPHAECPVAYQDACHLANAQGIRQQPRALLRKIPGLMLKELGDGGMCCGSAGVYNLTNPDISRELQRRKVDAIVASGASTVVTANPGCLMQMRAGVAEVGADVQVKHIVELLDAATASQ
ncbi:MAG: (Fe-S)-binding protein [Chloroflexi bacterium]|nr:(Fe-S)-binding protein [Chloroflexota bacterium]